MKLFILPVTHTLRLAAGRKVCGNGYCGW